MVGSSVMLLPFTNSKPKIIIASCWFSCYLKKAVCCCIWFLPLLIDFIFQFMSEKLKFPSMIQFTVIFSL